MKLKIALSAVALALSLASSAAGAETMPKFTGNLLVDAKGMTLYTYNRDVQGKSNCSASCAVAWPPAAVAADARAEGAFTIVAREDGSRQWAHKGLPLYRYAGDARAGDANGDKQGNVWHVVRTGAAAQAPQTHSSGSSMGYTY